MRIEDFLGPFFPTERELIRLRTFPPPSLVGAAQKIVTSRASLRFDLELQAALLKLNLNSGIYFVVNAGGDRDAEISRFNAFFAEGDEQPMADQHRILSQATVPPAIRVETKKSVHAYWLIAGPCKAGEWRMVQMGLIAHLKTDPSIKNASRLMRLPFFNHVSTNEDGNLSYKRVEVVEFAPDRRVTVDEMLAAFPLTERPRRLPALASFRHTNDIVRSSFDIRKHLHLIDGYHEQGEWGRGRCPAHQGNGYTSFFANLVTGAFGCFRGCRVDEIRAALGCPITRTRVTVLRGGQLVEAMRATGATGNLPLEPTRPTESVLLDLQSRRPESSILLRMNQ